ncbi:unnamed protein product [Staurois parvus]|uniref:Uncharacterized protein n=1 Tax=Staurois parvus TaxID=386267 RepID=A0ABN9E574_9NEOB|nr:unnamed protein product [Staurois parvus]
MALIGSTDWRLALMSDIERQFIWALICGIDVHWYALICGIDVALMGTGTSH